MVTNPQGVIAYSSSSTGEVTVNGADSQWINSDTLSVGEGGGGTLNVENGGSVTGTDSYLARYSTSNGTATVTGDDSSWASSGSMYIGGNESSAGGTAAVSVLDGGTLSVAGETRLHAGSTLTLSGAASTLQLDGVFTDEGTFDWQSGAVVLNGASASWDYGASDFTVGDTTNQSFTLQGGAQMSNAFGDLGYRDDGIGTATVTGTNSRWDNANQLSVGRDGTGTLNVEAGGSVTATKSFLGVWSDSSGMATVTGADSSWDNSDELYVGQRGMGTLTVADGGSVTGTRGNVGRFSGSNGTVTVTGAGSSWICTGDLTVGEDGSGTLYIESGGEVSSPRGDLGQDTGSTGEATVNGADSQWTISGSMNVGLRGTGVLSIEAGGTVTATAADVGWYTGSEGTVTVTGAGSLWTISGMLVGSGGLGNGGDGTLNIDAGGEVANNFGYIGYYSGSTGEVTVTGADSQWTNSSDLYIGGSSNTAGGTGTVSVLDGGSLDVGGVTKIYSGSTLTLGSGTFTSGGITMAGGTIAASAAAGEVGGLFLSDVGQLSGYGDISLLVHLGETGEVSGSGSGLNISGGLTGSGSVSDAVLGGSVDIGNSAGVLELEDVVVDSTAIFGIEISGTTLADYDRMLLAGGVTLDGVMNVSFIDGFVPAESDVFQLIDRSSATVTGWFSSVNAPTGWSLNASGQLYNISTVPEPSTLLLALLGLALLPRRRRR